MNSEEKKTLLNAAKSNKKIRKTYIVQIYLLVHRESLKLYQQYIVLKMDHIHININDKKEIFPCNVLSLLEGAG